MLIGPSGSGKSTISKILKQRENTVIYSWDALRLEMYDKEYSTAFKMSCEDKEFNSKVMNIYYDLINHGKNIVIDNVNLTPKSRNKFLNYAKQNDYYTIGVLFDVPVNILIERQITRPDKTISERVVREQFDRLILPSDDEFDLIINSSSIII